MRFFGMNLTSFKIITVINIKVKYLLIRHMTENNEKVATLLENNS